MKLNQLYLASGVMLTMASSSFASDAASTAGDNLLTTLNGLLTGNLMLFVGLAVAVLGLWMWLVKQETMAGILMIIGGVALTASPAIFNTASKVVTPVVDQMGNATEKSGARVQ